MPSARRAPTALKVAEQLGMPAQPAFGTKQLLQQIATPLTGESTCKRERLQDTWNQNSTGWLDASVLVELHYCHSSGSDRSF